MNVTESAESIARQVGIIKEGKTVQDLATEMKVDVKQVDSTKADAAVMYGPDLETMTQDVPFILFRNGIYF